MCVNKEKDPEVKQVYFYLFKVQIHILNTIPKLEHWKNSVSYDTTTKDEFELEISSSSQDMEALSQAEPSWGTSIFELKPR